MPARPDPTNAIGADGLIKTYGKGAKSVRALDGVGFTVAQGRVFGLLGPNGAGKSTTVKILATLSRADGGEARVGGVDVSQDPARVRRLIGYVSQKPCFDPVGTGTENLVLQGRMYGMTRVDARRRSAELLDRFGLAEAADRLTGKWSGGMQRKLDVAMGLVHRPEVLFLDEPTTGLDPEARAEMWAEIKRLSADDGLTVLLTTHYLDEADHLADTLAIVDRGRVVAAGTPEELKLGLAGDTVQIELASPADGARAGEVLRRVTGVRDVVTADRSVRARVTHGPSSLPGVLAALDDASIALTAVTVARPSLDDVYLRYAGRAFRSAGVAGDAAGTAMLEQVA